MLNSARQSCASIFTASFADLRCTPTTYHSPLCTYTTALPEAIESVVFICQILADGTHITASMGRQKLLYSHYSLTGSGTIYCTSITATLEVVQSTVLALQPHRRRYNLLYYTTDGTICCTHYNFTGSVTIYCTQTKPLLETV